VSVRTWKKRQKRRKGGREEGGENKDILYLEAEAGEEEDEGDADGVDGPFGL
jgi:hypothetical protein